MHLLKRLYDNLYSPEYKTRTHLDSTFAISSPEAGDEIANVNFFYDNIVAYM